jgi:hypothetical protein
MRAALFGGLDWGEEHLCIQEMRGWPCLRPMLALPPHAGCMASFPPSLVAQDVQCPHFACLRSGSLALGFGRADPVPLPFASLSMLLAARLPHRTTLELPVQSEAHRWPLFAAGSGGPFQLCCPPAALQYMCPPRPVWDAGSPPPEPLSAPRPIHACRPCDGLGGALQVGSGTAGASGSGADLGAGVTLL